jgi:hypothetical protein
MAEIELPRRIGGGGGGRRAVAAPTAADVQQVRIARDPGVRASPAAFGAGTGEGLQQAATGLADFGGSMAKASDKLLTARRRLGVSTATTRATADMRAFVLDLEQDTDVETYGTRFEERAKQAFATYGGGLDALGQAEFRANFEALSLEQAYQVRKLANGRLVDQTTATLDQSLDDSARLAASSGSEKEYADLVTQATRSIEEAELSGIITAEDAGKRRRAFAGRLDEVTAMQEISADPAKAVERLTDPELFPNLDPKRRQAMLDSAISKADIAQRRSAAEAERQDRLAEKRMNEEGEGLLKETYDLMDAGATPTTDQLDALKHHEGVSPSEYRGILTSLEKDGTVEDDPATIAYLMPRLHDEDVSQELTLALDEGMLKPETYRTLFNQNKTNLSDNRPDSPFKSGRGFLKAALDPGQLGGDPVLRQALTLAQANASADYDTWFEANQEATRAQAMEQAKGLMEQYQNVAFDQMRLALPRPRGYAGAKQGVSMEAVERARDALATEIQSGRLTDEQAAREIDQLNVWERILGGAQ